MRHVLVCVAGLACVAAGQTQPPLTPSDSGFTRGVLLERDSEPAAGEFAVRLPDNEVLRYSYDAHTYVEQAEHNVDIPRLHPGEQVEVVSDSVDGSRLRYARTVHAVGATRTAARRRVPTFVPLHHFSMEEERLIPKGDLTYAGVIGEIAGSRMVLHTRSAGDQTIVLRNDTRYLQNGEIVGAADLRPNLRVFVRAGRTWNGDVEGYQVIWGQILQVERQ